MGREEVKKVKEMSKSRMKNRKGYEKWKRLSDIILSALGLIVLSPLFLLLILWIKVDSKGPVFFKQKRVGIQDNANRYAKGYADSYADKSGAIHNKSRSVSSENVAG